MSRLRTSTIQFYMGPAQSGAQPHWHGSAFNWLVHGRKRWLFWPPSDALYTQSHVARALNATALAEPTGRRGRRRFHRRKAAYDEPLLCDQHAGEVVIVPELWGHATYNLEPSLGWASEFFFDRAFDDGLGDKHGEEWWRTGERWPTSAHGRSTSRSMSRSERLRPVPLEVTLGGRLQS